MKNTEGPWHLDQYGHVYGWSQFADGRKEAVVLLDGRHSKANVKDRRLISAAPDLLESLKKIDLACASIPEGYLQTLSDALSDARRAIAKATGEEK